jgi:coenzyme F420-dependent glucose-6-phosphate dehydrogenase
MERLADALPVERTVTRWLVSADPQEHFEQVRQYIDMGFTHLVFHFPGPDQERALRLYSSEILPLLRQEAQSRKMSGMNDSVVSP